MSAPSRRACAARSSRILRLRACARYPARAASRGENHGSMAAKYDLVVLGAGPAGEKGAAQAAYFGKRVVVVDPNPRPGGIAVSTAGIPTKTIREGAIYLSGLGQSAIGVRPASVQDSWRLLMARKLEVSDRKSVV